MEMMPATTARTADGRRIAAAESAVADLDRRLAEWDEQRAAVVSDELGSDPHLHVPGTWPVRASGHVSTAAGRAAPLSTRALAAECSALRWAGVGKLIGAGVSITVILAVPVSLVLGALG